MKLVKRWDSQNNCWNLGYWVGTRFYILGRVKLVD